GRRGAYIFRLWFGDWFLSGRLGQGSGTRMAGTTVDYRAARRRRFERRVGRNDDLRATGGHGGSCGCGNVELRRRPAYRVAWRLSGFDYRRHWTPSLFGLHGRRSEPAGTMGPGATRPRREFK